MSDPKTRAIREQTPRSRENKHGANRKQRSGERASKTLALHRHIYAADAAARCVIHTHSTHLVALTLQGVWSNDDIVPPITPYYVMKVGHVPLIPYRRPGDAAVGDLVAQRIAAARSAGRTIFLTHGEEEAQVALAEDIRGLVASGGSTLYCLPWDVQQLIAKKGLYGADQPAAHKAKG